MLRSALPDLDVKYLSCFFFWFFWGCASNRNSSCAGRPFWQMKRHNSDYGCRQAGVEDITRLLNGLLIECVRLPSFGHDTRLTLFFQAVRVQTYKFSSSRRLCQGNVCLLHTLTQSSSVVHCAAL